MDNIILPVEYWDIIKDFDDVELGKLMRAVYEYQVDGKEPTLESSLQIAFRFFRQRIDFLKDKYRETCENNRRNARKRWNRDNATAYNRMRPHTTAYNRIRPDANDANVSVNDNSNSKSNKIKEKEEKEKPSFSRPHTLKEKSYSEDEKMNKALNLWFAYKKERGQTYKAIGEKSLITRLENLSGGDGMVAMKIVERSIANNWAGLFAREEDKVKPEDTGIVLKNTNDKNYSEGGW